jgi:hypothetical protein
MMKTLLMAVFLLIGANTFAFDFNLKYGKEMSADDKNVLEKTMAEVAGFLPSKFKEHLPDNIEIKITQLTNHKVIPDDVCNYVKKKNPFTYGAYNKYANTLLINRAVIAELKKGENDSKKIDCQHKSLYGQAIATIIHELTHAYDQKNGRVSNSIEFINRAGFKKGLVRIKNKNIQAMRSADPYELANIAEAFAVNMEYFTMDPEFMCRKPSMFDFYQRLFGVDPFPNRTCVTNDKVMVSTQSGYVSTQLDLKRVYRIDYLLASPGQELMSGLGHTMFRIVICAPEHFDNTIKKMIPATPFGKECLEDKAYHLVVSYRANVTDGKVSYLKGLFGGYPSILFLLPFGDVLDEYNRDELRDVIAYPLKLTKKERDEFITRVKEEHWNYRGAYKFATSNCATESYDLLKSALETSPLNSKSSLSPKGVLEDLDKLEFLSVSDSEAQTFEAKTESIILAYKDVYDYKLQNAEADKKAVKKFVYSSTASARMAKFIEFSQNTPAYYDVYAAKERLSYAASFSVMEQQILRSVGLNYRKKAADILENSKDEKLRAMLQDSSKVLVQPFSSLSSSGYGIPLAGEVISNEELSHEAEDATKVLAESEKILRAILPEEFKTLAEIEENIKIYNAYSFQVGREYRLKFNQYVKESLRSLALQESTREILIKASKGDQASLLKTRELLDQNLVTTDEILDVRLAKIIRDLL